MDPMGYVVFFFCIEFWLESLTWCFFGSMIYFTCFFLAMRFGLVSCDFCQPRVMLCLYMYVLTEGFDLVVFFCHTDDVNDLMIQPASPQSMNRFSSSTGWNSWSAALLPQKGSKLMLVKGCWVVSTESASPQNTEIWKRLKSLWDFASSTRRESHQEFMFPVEAYCGGLHRGGTVLWGLGAKMVRWSSRWKWRKLIWEDMDDYNVDIILSYIHNID